MSKFLDLMKKVLTLGLIEPDSDKKEKGVPKITNRILLKELVTHFKQRMEELSFDGRILYPMSFNIFMHPDDYNETKESLPFVLPEVVSQFYTKIKEEKAKFPEGVNYAPPATYWFFQFTACQFVEKDGMENLIERGRIITTGNLTTFDIKKAQTDNTYSEQNIHLSVKCQNSNTNANNINMEALLGMDILSDGAYTFNFDKNMKEDAKKIQSSVNSKKNGWATLEWMEGNMNKTFVMLDTYIDVSGQEETRSTRNICRIDNEAVAVSHVQIQYDPSSQIFLLAAYAKTRLNGREVPISSNASPEWVQLPKFNSKIFLNDTVSVEFNANADLI